MPSLGWLPHRTIRARQHDDADPFAVTHVQEVWIRRGERLGRAASSLGGDTVGHAHRASSAVIVPGTQSSCGCTQGGVGGSRFEQAQLGQIQRGVLLIGSRHPDQLVQNLGQADRSQ